MRRPSPLREFVDLIRFFRSKVPELTIATDIIVGFPGESPESFQNTLELIKSIRPDIVNISRFSPRKGTPAASLPAMHSRESKELSRKLSRLCNKISIEQNSKLIGKELNVLFIKNGTRNHQYRGRTDNYKPVVVESKSNLLGKFARVKIAQASKDHLLASFVSEI